MKRLSIERVREVLDYDAETGCFRWRVRLNRRITVGSIAGSDCHGYRKVSIDGVEVLLHRAAWAHHHGEWPKHEIDHINGVRTDNRITNLRDVTPQVNAENRRAAYSNNASGLMGVTAIKDKWLARICVNKKNIRLGLFSSSAEAHAAYLAAKRQLHEGSTL